MCLTIIAAPQSNTPNLYKRHHKIQEEIAMKDKKTMSENTSWETTQILTTSHRASAAEFKRHKIQTDTITYHLAKDMAPFNTVKLSSECVQKAPCRRPYY